MSDVLKAQREAIAYRIRAELVCCDVYQRGQDLLAAFYPADEVDRGLAWHRFMAEHDNHTLCYYGEAAARLAESFDDSEESESDARPESDGPDQATPGQPGTAS